MPLTSKTVQAAFLFFVSYDNRRREYLSQCSLQAGTHTRKLTFQQDSHISFNSSPPSHSRCALLDTLAPSTSCFGRFRCAKNNTQLFLTCYISPLKNILLLVCHCRNKIVVVPGHVFQTLTGSLIRHKLLTSASSRACWFGRRSPEKYFRATISQAYFS